MAQRADCGSVHLTCCKGRVSTTKEQKAGCGILRQRRDLGGLICCSDMIRLERGGRQEEQAGKITHTLA